MTKGNFNRQQIFSSASRARFFLLSQNEVSMRHGSCSTVQAFVLLCQTPQFAFGQFARRRLVSDDGDGDGWFIPARTLLDARLFQSPPKVAGFNRDFVWALRLMAARGLNIGSGIFLDKALDLEITGRITGEKVCNSGTGRDAVAAEIEVEASAESGRECNKKCSKTGESVWKPAHL